MARLDTGWHAHPKILKLGLAAMGLHAWSISYCDALLTDGFVPSCAWPALPGVAAAVKRLVDAGLWIPVSGGYLLHDYIDYNRSKAQVDAYMAAKTEAGRAGGQASAQARATAKAQPRAQPSATANVQQTLKQNPTPGPGDVLITTGRLLRQAGRNSRDRQSEIAATRARAREDAVPDEVQGVLVQPSVSRRFDRRIGQPAKPASPSNISQEYGDARN